jgi:hypothetical protein
LFVLPQWQSFGRTYVEALSALFTLLPIRRQRDGGFVNRLSLSPDLTKLRTHAVQAEDPQSNKQPATFRVTPAHFGASNFGLSAGVVIDSLPDWQFPLCVFEVGMMLVTHPEILSSADIRFEGIICPGTVCLSEPKSKYQRVPVYRREDGGLILETIRLDQSLENCGPAIGFVPKLVHRDPREHVNI